MRHRSTTFVIVFLIVISLIASACGAADTTNTNSNEGAAATPESTPTPSPATNEEGSSNEAETDTFDPGAMITLYGNDFVDEIAPKFSEDTGYKMEAVHYGGGAALAKIEAEQGNPQWDVVMMDGHGSIRNLADRGFLLTDWTPSNLENLTDYGQSLVPDDHAYTPMGIHASALIAYNTNVLNEDTAPKTWEEFFAYEGPVGHADPAVAAPAYPLVSSFFHKYGVEETKALYNQRFEDGLYVYPKNGPVSKALINGEIHVAALQEHQSYQLMLDGEPVQAIWPDEGAPGSLRVIAINKDSKNLEAAKAFVEYMLESETQSFLTTMESSNSSFFTPLAEGAAVRKERRQDGTFLLPPAEWAAEHENEIKTWFADRNVN